MTAEQVLKHYKGEVMLAAYSLGVTTTTFYNWQNNGIPYFRQLDIEKRTGGKLKADKK
jgi:hypothetical protein